MCHKQHSIAAKYRCMSSACDADPLPRLFVQAYEYYIEKYPDGPNKVLGFLSYDVLLNCQLDHIYTAWYFYALIGVLAASLMACTVTSQWPAVKVSPWAPD